MCYLKKTLCIILILIILIANMTIVLADDLNEDNINDEEIKEEIIDVSTNVENLPNTNSRAVLILDRGSKKVIYEKNGYSRRAMASTTNVTDT